MTKSVGKHFRLMFSNSFEHPYSHPFKISLQSGLACGRTVGKTGEKGTAPIFSCLKNVITIFPFLFFINYKTEQVTRPFTKYQISIKILCPWKSEWNAFNKNYTQDFFEMIQIKITLLYHPSIQYLKEEKIWRKKTSNICC